MKRALVALGLACLALAWCHSAAWAWAVNSHIFSANEIIEELERTGGAIEIHELVRNDDGTATRELLGGITVPADVVDAILQQRDAFRAGSCSADGYPDMYVGQSIIHPYEAGQKWRAIDWAMHLVQYAREWGGNTEQKQQALAFAYGWLVHYAGDAFGHTWVNQYAGGAWDWGNMGIVNRHVAIEAYMNTKLPGAADGTLDKSLHVDTGFIRDALIMHDDIQSSIVRAGYLKALVDYHDMFDRAERKCERRMDQWWNPVSWGIAPVEAWLEHQRKESSRAMLAWADGSNQIMGHVTEGEFYHVPGVVSSWMGVWLPKLVLGIPQWVLDVIGWLGVPIDWIMGPLEEGLIWMAEYAYDQLLAETFEALVNPEQYMLAAYGEEVRQQVDAEFRLDQNDGVLDWENFAPLHDTIVLGKLALLDSDGINELSGLLGVEIPTSGAGDNILWECMNSLDASHQLSLYPVFRLLETDELRAQAFERLFLSEAYAAPPSIIDPTHFAIYGDHREPVKLTFMTPLEDPCTDQARVTGYVYETPEGGGEQRVAIYEAGVPTGMAEGLMTDTIMGNWTAPAERTYRFHLAGSLPEEGTVDLLPDAGVDVTWPVQEYDMPDLPPVDFPTAEVAAMLQGLQAMGEEGAAAEGLTPEQRATMQEMQAMAAEGLRQMREFMEGGGFEGAMAEAVEDRADPYTFSPDEVAAVIERASDPAPDLPDDMDIPEEVREMMAQRRSVLGVVESQEGLPVQGAMVTLVEKDLHDALRSAPGVPHVRFDEWLMDRYYIGRTNEEGQFMLLMVKEGEYVLVGSAPGHPKTRRPQTIVHGEGRAVILPTLTLAPPAEEDDAGPGDAAGGQHIPRPDFVLEMIPPVLTWDEAEADGAARGTLRVRCLSDYAGELRLGAEGVPEGVALAFGANPAPVAGVTDVPVTVRARDTRGGMARIRLVATDGVRTNTTTLVVAMSAGQLRTEPERPTLRPGGRAQVRVHWDAIDGMGQAAMFSVERLPRSVWVKVDTIRAHPHVEPLRLEGLTPEKALEAGAALRPGLPVPVEGPLRLPTITMAQIERAPAEAPFRGVLLGPGGWVDLTVAVGADITGDTVSVPVTCEIGPKVVKQTLEFTVAR